VNRHEIVELAAPYERWQVGDTLAEALGTEDRPDPVLPRGGGPAGNARLTAWVGMVLFVLLFVEGVTLIDIHGLISWHITVGLLLVPPVLLKLASTGWRLVRYYIGHPAYRAAGAPPMPLRLLGPLVVLTTVALLATGILIGFLGPESSRRGLWGTPASPLFFHQAAFAGWIVVTTLHVLGRLVPAFRILTGRAVASARVGGGVVRGVLVVMAAAAAVGMALLLFGDTTAWQNDVFRFVSDH
jgi:hypothetical protein